MIRGDCNTGKTCLWLRLQGKPFKESYEPTDEIQISNINWNYKLSDTDIVKVEIWDVVDKSRKKRQLSNGLKIENSANASQTSQQIEASLDAEFIDVYKNCNGCILVYDITKHWTWEYIERELPRIPAHIPVLILGNHLDMQHHRTITEMKCRYFIESLNRLILFNRFLIWETYKNQAYKNNAFLFAMLSILRLGNFQNKNLNFCLQSYILYICSRVELSSNPFL